MSGLDRKISLVGGSIYTIATWSLIVTLTILGVKCELIVFNLCSTISICCILNVSA